MDEEMEQFQIEKIAPPAIWKDYACGWGAALVNIAVTYPINKIIFRQMFHGVDAKSAFMQLYEEGFYFLYRGILPPLCQKTLSVSVMFGVYEQVRRPLVDAGCDMYVAKTVGGVVSGCMESVLMPFERVQALLSVEQYHERFKNTAHAFRVIGTQFGFREFYRGLMPILYRNGPSNACFFILRDEAHELLPHYEKRFTKSVCDFITGALIGVFISSVFYPINVGKISMQTKVGGEFENFFKVLGQVYRERGSKIRFVYRGVYTNCTRAFVSWGVINTAYENLKLLIY